MKYREEEPDNEVTWLVLLSMEIELTKENIATWSQEQRNEVVNWADACMLKASDNAYIRIPPKPDFL